MARTATELRQEAAAHRAAARESFERCDTDGFLSQYADGMMARLRDTEAQVAENGGQAWFARWTLTDADGRELDARRVETRYGTKWRIDETDEWITYGSARAARRRGYELGEVIELADAGVSIDGRGTGLSGQAWVAVWRRGAARTAGWRCVGVTEEEIERYRAMVAEEGVGI